MYKTTYYSRFSIPHKWGLLRADFHDKYFVGACHVVSMQVADNIFCENPSTSETFNKLSREQSFNKTQSSQPRRLFYFVSLIILYQDNSVESLSRYYYYLVLWKIQKYGNGSAHPSSRKRDGINATRTVLR